MWSLAAPGLTDAFEVITFDFPGHGTAPVSSEEVTIAGLSDALAQWLDDAGLAHVHLGGISLGGIVAQDFASRYPDRVDRLVLIDTTPRYTDEMRTLWAERAATARSAGVAAMADALLAVWFSPAAISANGPGVRYVRSCFDTVSGEGYARACEALAAADTRSQLASIRARTLVVCGDDDLPSFIEAANSLANDIPKAELLWIEGGRHAAILEQPDLFAAALRSFLGPAER